MWCREIALGGLVLALVAAGCSEGSSSRDKKRSPESEPAATAGTAAAGPETSAPNPGPSTPASSDAPAPADDRPPLSDAETSARIAIYLAAVDRACDSGVESSCWFQGIVYARGLLGQAADPARAASYYKRGCNADLAGPSCPERLASKTKLSSKERAALAALCARGRIDACRRVGGAESDAHLCNAGVLAACDRLPATDSSAASGPPAAAALPETAAEPAKRAAAACDKGSAYGCALLARAYLDGAHGLAADPARAFALGGRACKRDGVTLGCYPAAKARLSTATSAREMNAALAIARKGCQRGDMAACAIIADALERSADPDSRQRGLSFWLMACHLPVDRPAGEADPEACAAFNRAVPRAVK